LAIQYIAAVEVEVEVVVMEVVKVVKVVKVEVEVVVVEVVKVVKVVKAKGKATEEVKG
jgi:hypothetical protein